MPNYLDPLAVKPHPPSSVFRAEWRLLFPVPRLPLHISLTTTWTISGLSCYNALNIHILLYMSL